ncbi:MAG: GNAT family N-acetyltransferase [Paludibacteraceae bacterium]|nr:GNAT family N-acetyltransferase [Paludibacteraceae bacterium]
MAIVNNTDYSIKHGKLNKKDNVIHRVRNGKEHMYSIVEPYQGPASKAQKDHRSLFGKVNSIVNHIMADPEQLVEWKARMDQYNRSLNVCQPPFPKRFKTIRQYVFSVVSEQYKKLMANRHNDTDQPTTLPHDITLHIAPFIDLSASDIYEILKARYAVFTLEQHIIYPDEDNIDYVATHISLRRNGLVIAYARLFPEAEKEVMRIGRMLTLTAERGKGLGCYLMNQVIFEAQRQGAAKIRLHAQTHAVPFYQRFGFQPVGDTFYEADIPHLCMEKVLS